jgi:N-acetylmuramoyl-L-alanine amidase
MKILIDNGHGSNTPGKCSPGGRLKEYAYAREIAIRLEAELRKKGIDAERIVKEEIDVPLSERCRRANEYKANDTILVSIHCNAAGSGSEWMQPRGWEAWTSAGQTKADKLADSLYAAAERLLPDMKIRKDMSDGDADKESGFYILKHTKCPAVLTENLFQDNKEDVDFLLSEEGKRAIVDLHVQGIVNYLNNSKKINIMASVDLNFTKEDKVYVADIASPGKCIVQIERKESGWTTVFSKVDNLEFSEVAKFPDGPDKKSVIFELNIPEGMPVRIQSNKEVEIAKYVTEG